MGHRRNRSWAREHQGQRDEAWFKREIAPKLDGFPLSDIAKTTDLSLARPAGASAPVRGCRIRGIGTACSDWLRLGTEPPRRTSLAADPVIH
jgi:hypothetical protein